MCRNFPSKSRGVRTRVRKRRRSRRRKMQRHYRVLHNSPHRLRPSRSRPRRPLMLRARKCAERFACAASQARRYSCVPSLFVLSTAVQRKELFVLCKSGSRHRRKLEAVAATAATLARIFPGRVWASVARRACPGERGPPSRAGRMPHGRLSIMDSDFSSRSMRLCSAASYVGTVK